MKRISSILSSLRLKSTSIHGRKRKSETLVIGGDEIINEEKSLAISGNISHYN